MSESDLEVARDDLGWLDEHGALAGVAEIIRERRRQIELYDWTVEHDDQHAQGWLIMGALARVTQLYSEILDGTAGYPEAEAAMREAGAMFAAETDRINRMLTPEADDG